MVLPGPAIQKGLYNLFDLDQAAALLLIGFQHERSKTCLREMPIRRQGDRKVVLLHNDEGDAVGKPPCLVRTSFVESQRPFKEF